MSKILVTGGAGFIGSNFVRYMVNKYSEYEIVNLDALTYCGNLENLKDIEKNDNYSFVKGDIRDKNIVDDLVQQCDYVINFAAESHVDRSITDPEIFIKSNVLGTQVLLNAAKKYGVDKYIQISTDEVYGTLGKTGYFKENTPLQPNSPYSASKAGGDLITRAYSETFDLPINITRCSNNYGPYQFPEKLIPLMISNALEDKKLPVYGDGKNIRDWLHVYDHCRAIDLVLHEGKLGEVYNIGGNNEKQNLEIVKLILNQLNKDESLIKFVKDRLGHDRRYAIDSNKIQEELGWSPKYTFEIGIKETIQWYLDNQEWTSKVKSGQYKDYYNKMYSGR
ncbi:MAG: dTDP-glucose 4,6-dehydratase [archaeon]|uniref:dTDP-glucose 4,6-dehydratase n=1 Tax=Methanobrevibacter gottschalkii DSM 11977 TaxID=1122229 RepID=A0A3N5C8K6_9EURY|nr:MULTISPECIES: dTDP-glucose 4,6-dehydratase [Methanobrevibacter]MCQ2970877.1 dTDP-glucose 4,6-dehydratase [archaeon]OEC99893.1 dTDP-glucose 4,6-dehydratase [Methanobrevibacter sp. A27]RPF52891.1 dTDP-glucose 4,6-dehydratase [Methanobrevibacter gottschalkii DSM 11977]